MQDVMMFEVPIDLGVDQGLQYLGHNKKIEMGRYSSTLRAFTDLGTGITLAAFHTVEI